MPIAAAPALVSQWHYVSHHRGERLVITVEVRRHAELADPPNAFDGRWRMIVSFAEDIE